jgi:hypothetical protein
VGEGEVVNAEEQGERAGEEMHGAAAEEVVSWKEVRGKMGREADLSGSLPFRGFSSDPAGAERWLGDG